MNSIKTKQSLSTTDKRGICIKEDKFINLYSWQGYTGSNIFMLGAFNRQHYYKLIGAMAVTELLDPPL